MDTQEQKQALGPVQFVEGIWEKISNDARVRGALTKMRHFVSNGPFIAIVVGAGGDSKPVTFGILPVVGLVQIGRVAQAIEEAVSGKPISINTMLTALQSLGAMSVPGMVVGTVISGAVNAVDLLVGPKDHQASRTLTSGEETPTTTSSTPELAQASSQVGVQGATQDQQDIAKGAGGAEAEKCEPPSGGGGSNKLLLGGIKEELAGGETHAAESDQGSGAKLRGYWYKVIGGYNPNSPRSKL